MNNLITQCQYLTSLSLTYDPTDNFLCIPEMAKLKRIEIEIDMWERDFTNPLFDFSKVPHASISVTATFYVEYKMYIPVCALLRLRAED